MTISYLPGNLVLLATSHEVTCHRRTSISEEYSCLVSKERELCLQSELTQTRRVPYIAIHPKGLLYGHLRWHPPSSSSGSTTATEQVRSYLGLRSRLTHAPPLRGRRWPRNECLSTRWRCSRPKRTWPPRKQPMPPALPTWPRRSVECKFARVDATCTVSATTTTCWGDTVAVGMRNKALTLIGPLSQLSLVSLRPQKRKDWGATGEMCAPPWILGMIAAGCMYVRIFPDKLRLSAWEQLILHPLTSLQCPTPRAPERQNEFPFLPLYHLTDDC